MFLFNRNRFLRPSSTPWLSANLHSLCRDLRHLECNPLIYNHLDDWSDFPSIRHYYLVLSSSAKSSSSQFPPHYIPRLLIKLWKNFINVLGYSSEKQPSPISSQQFPIQLRSKLNSTLSCFDSAVLIIPTSLTHS